jgi:hypothetical protein
MYTPFESSQAVANASVSPGLDYGFSIPECNPTACTITAYLEIQPSDAVKVGSASVKNRRSDPTKPWKSIRDKK